MNRLIGALVLTFAVFGVRQAGATDCPNHCTEDRIDYFAHIECYGPEAVSHDACNRMVALLIDEMSRRNIPCEHPSVWLDNQSGLARVNCATGGAPPNLKLISTAYGMGVIHSPDGLRVMTFGQITDDAMWSQWLAKARHGPVLGTASGAGLEDEENPYKRMLRTMSPVLMESIQSVGHVCDSVDAIALNDALPGLKYYHVTCNSYSLRYTVGVSPKRTLVWPGDIDP